MRPLLPRFSPRFFLGLTCALLAAGLLGACDGHAPGEVPKSYGHGSNRSSSRANHEIDSEKRTHSYSDTRGTDEEGEHGKEGEHKEHAAESPSPSQPGRFFPNGS